MTEPITPRAFEEAGGTEDWRVVGDGACAFYRTATFAESARLIAAIAGLADVAAHPPDVDLRADGVTLRLVTADERGYGMSTQDVAAAQAISEAARGLGLAADPAAVQSVLVIPGSADPSTIMPFWEAVLGYSRRPDTPDEDLVDPRGRGPAFWFEAMRQPRADGGGSIHVAVWVPAEHAEARVAAALAAGGRLVRDTHAPMWWTLADAAGNEADVSTIRERA